jgi:hypothetical protein
MLAHKAQTSNNKLYFAYCILFSTAAITFALATLCTLPLFEEEIVLPLYALMLKASAVSFILAELAEAIADPSVKCSCSLCLLAVIGNCIYYWSTLTYPTFNKGGLYLMGQFCVSLAF